MIASNERLFGMFEFLSQYKATKRYAENVDDLVAIAQHYGIPTDFIDFTKSPEIAIFFATHSKQNLIGKEGVILCLNGYKFSRFVKFCDILFEQKDIPPPYIYETKIDNLWRLKAQGGCFMQSCIIDLETLYPLDKIVFPHSDNFEHINILT